MSLVQITQPTGVPVSLAEVRAHCRLDGIDDASQDAVLLGFIRTATDAVEQMTGLRLIDQTWEYAIDGFPRWCNWLRLPLAPLLSIMSIVYQDETGTVLTLPTGVYLIRGLGSTQPASLILAPEQQWPTTWRGYGAVLIRARFGWIDHNGVPHDLRQAVSMLAAYWFSQREAASVGDHPISDVPFSVRALLEPYRLWAV